MASFGDVQILFEKASTYYAKISPTNRISVEPGFDDTDYYLFNGDYYSFYIHNNLNTTDKYVQCAECGRYIPIGDITKKLDDNLICTGHEDSAGSYIDDDYFAYTYDEVLFIKHNNGLLPESAFTRTSQHYEVLGIIHYEDYLAYFGITPDVENAPLQDDPLTEDYSSSDEPVSDDYSSSDEPVSDDYSSSDEAMPDVVYVIDTINYY